MRSFFHVLVCLGSLACIVSGAAGFVLLRFLPPALYAAWFLPLLALLAGFFILLREVGFRHGTGAVLVIFLVIEAGSHFVWPRGVVPVSTTSSVTPGYLQRVKVSAPLKYRSGVFLQDRYLSVPPGTTVSLFRGGLEGVRWIAFGPKGGLYASLPRAGEVVRLVDDDGDGYAEILQIIASGLDQPHGLAFDGSDLLVAGESTLYRLHDVERSAVVTAEVISRDLPGGGGHWTRSVAVDGKRNIFVSAGSSCNACEESDPRRASIRMFAPQGGEGEPFANGLRNSVGITFHPRTGELWGADNGRDMLGDDLPPEEINLLRAGNDYGWPYCYGDRLPDPQLGSPQRCGQTTPPAVTLPAHLAPLGILFGSELKATEEVRDALLVASHGCWNRSTPAGYKILAVPFAEGRPAGVPRDLVSGWLVDGKAWGRPVALATGPDGALYVSDDRAGAIYRVMFKSSP